MMKEINDMIKLAESDGLIKNNDNEEDIYDPDYCHRCGKYRVIDNDMYCSCPQCGETHIVKFYVASSFADGSEFVRKKHYFYDRRTYFDSLLLNLQSHECTEKLLELEPDVTEKIKIAMGTSRDTTTLKDILKGYKMKQYYKHVYAMLLFLYDTIKPNVLTLSEVSKLRVHFDCVNREYIKMFPNKKNFMSYNFVLKKLLVVIARVDLAGMIPQPKSDIRKETNEKLWNKIYKTA